MKKFIIVLILIVITIIIFVLLLFKNTESEPESINLDSSQETLENNIKKMTDIENQIKDIADNYGLDISEHHMNSEDHMAYYSQKKGVVEFLFASLEMNDSELFLQSFDMVSISNDLFKVEQVDKEEVAKTIMNKLTRNNSLKSIEYIDEKGLMGSISDQATVKVVYEDGLEVTIPLQFEILQDQQSSLYSISTSVWDMIDIIEKSTN